MKSLYAFALALSTTAAIAGHPRCAGSVEPAKCEKLQAEIDAETPEARKARQAKLEDDRKSAAAAANAQPVSASTSSNSEYPGPWKDDLNVDISRAFVAKQIRGCGEYRYKESRATRTEYLVHCTRDGKNWVAYLVWTRTGAITGPFKADE
ncbi:hypothetical protein HNP48_004687 [Acidovorax soli]|uniref:Uncharacterized protein n=1 Tax=Acidovorax soli TaxID=592050 RepID=A0A7X0PHD8_9BURK|nr:hypothetical protein [Acidovorax soli]MBB6561985.1 hypothetical protein [Acidovorax soli]